jgi:hypothetical protein
MSPHGMQAVLLATSLLLVAAMLGTLAWVSALRQRPQAEAVPAEPVEDTV